MKSVFIHPEDAFQFEKKGYLRKKLLDCNQIIQAKKLYQGFFPEGTKNFYSSTFIKNSVLKKEISQELTQLFVPSINEYFENYKLLGAQFLIKNPGELAKMPFHQDWTVVNENEFRSLTVWIGLENLTEKNGTIKVVPGTQEFSRSFRGPGNFDNLVQLQNHLEKEAQTLILEAGEAFIFDHSLIHGSGINHSESPRIAIALGLFHKDAGLVFYHKSTPHHFEKYKVKDDFFLTFPNTNLAPEDSELIETLQVNFEKIKVEDFILKMETLSNTHSNLTTIHALFANEETQKRFDEDGYVKINLLNENEVNDLRAYYQSLHHDHIGEYGFHISLENKSPDYVEGVFKKLFSTILPKLDSVLRNYKAFTASFVIKEAGLQNIVPPHQDWSFVDEEQYCSATVWIPLMDVNKSNGALGVIKGSHRKFNLPRSSPSPQAKSILSDHAFTLFPFVEIIDMKAGEALIFNNKTIHASPPNVSGKTRIAAGIGITQKNAQLVHHYQMPGKDERVLLYEVDESFFPKYNNSILSSLFDHGESPTGLKCISKYSKSKTSFNTNEIINLVCSKPGVNRNDELMHELAEFYHYNIDGTKKEQSTLKNTTMEKSNESPAKVNENNASVDKTNSTQKPSAVQDTRTFFQKYTPANILAEIKYRIKKN